VSSSRPEQPHDQPDELHHAAGLDYLLPGNVDEGRRTDTTTLALPRTRPRTIRISEGRPGFARGEGEGRRLGQREADDLTTAVRRILNVDEDLSDFYALVADDPDLSWARGVRKFKRPRIHG
jgi:hypothetical protein